ncbi:zf-HC2 domain-containing protein [bacterium]|nr:zf-HC2 domain-containing protein [bacterium]
MKERCPTVEALLKHIEGRDEGVERTLIERHLADCPECRTRAAGFRGLLEDLKTAAVAPELARDECAAGYDASAYVDGDLGFDECAAFEEHVAGCRSCLAELSDLIAVRRADAPLPSDEMVASVLDRLSRERSRVVLRLTSGVLEFIEGWIDTATALVAGSEPGSGEPVVAGVRSASAPVTLRWETGDKYLFLCEFSATAAGAEVMGRVLRDGRPALDLAVDLRGRSGSHGPESLDARGRFGPWRLAAGESMLSFRALGLRDGLHPITIEIAAENVEKV